MVTKEGPKVLEFNARFGDPETQVYLARLKSDLLDLFEASVDGQLSKAKLVWSKEAAVCVVMASGGYPGPYQKGLAITGLEAVSRMPHVKVFHAGTALQNGSVVTSGGRVLGVTAWGANLAEARDRAYGAVAQIHFEGAHYRRDIAARGLAC
jgi:phosphoribosylamine--glycine ligase